MIDYRDYIAFMQNQPQPRLDNPYGGLQHGLSSIVGGYLQGRDIRHRREYEDLLGKTLLQAQQAADGTRPGLGGGMPSQQVAAMGAGMPSVPGMVPDNQAIYQQLAGMGGNPYAREMLAGLAGANLEAGIGSKHKMAEKAFGGVVDKDVYRDRRGADMGYERFMTGELGTRGETKLEQELRQRQGEAGINIWEHGTKAGIDTRHENLRGESELDRLRRQYGYQADEAIRQKAGELGAEAQYYDRLNPEKMGQPIEVIGPDGRPMLIQAGDRGGFQPVGQYAPYEKELNPGVQAAENTQATEFFESNGVEGDYARNITRIGPRILAGDPTVTPQERTAFNISIAKATEPKTIESNGQLIQIPGMTQEQLFQGIALSMPGAQQPQAPTQPMPSRRDANPPLNMERIVDAVIQQESAGNPTARSTVGAFGLMQLMPKTAMEVAREMGIRNFKVDWLANPEVNKKLGTFYLQKQMDAFGGNLPMALAAYNAGPGAVNKWRKTIGDPLKGEISVREWASRLPYKETRNYIARIMGNLEGQGGVAPAQAQLPPQPPMQSQFQPQPVPVPPAMDNQAVPQPSPPPMQAPMQQQPQPLAAPITSPEPRVIFERPPSPKDDALARKAEADAKIAETKLQVEQRDASKTDAKREALQQVMLSRLDSAEKLLNRENYTQGLSGNVAAWIPGTDANYLSDDIMAIKNQFIGENLDMMKGVLSDTDLAVLGRLAGELNMGMSDDKKLRVIRDMRDIITAGTEGPDEIPTTKAIRDLSDEELLRLAR